MPNLLKSLTASAAAICLTAFSASTLAGSNCSKNKENTNILFVVQSSNATLTPLKDNQYQLTIPANSVKKVLAFTDRPKRFAITMTPQQYLKFVQSGKQSFSENAPNISLAWNSGLPAHSYQILTRTQSASVATYKLKLLDVTQGPKKEITGGLNMFVDTYNTALCTLCRAFENCNRLPGQTITKDDPVCCPSCS